MLAFMSGTTKNYSARVPLDLAERLEKIKLEQAHKLVSDSAFLIEAVRFYVDHAEKFGIDDNLTVNEPDRPYDIKKPPRRTREGPHQKKTGSS